MANVGSSLLYDRSPEEGLPVSDWLQVFANTELQDAHLSENGVELCTLAGERAKNANFRLVFVSP